METARTLEEKRERVLEQMRAIRSMRPGSVTEQYLKVTHKGKRKPVMRGPYWVYTRKEGGKTVGQRLSREDAEQVKKDIEAHRKFVALCKEFETLTRRCCMIPTNLKESASYDCGAKYTDSMESITYQYSCNNAPGVRELNETSSIVHSDIPPAGWPLPCPSGDRRLGQTGSERRDRR